MRILQIAVFAFTLVPLLAQSPTATASLQRRLPSSRFRFNSRLAESGSGTVPTLQIMRANTHGPLP